MFRYLLFILILLLLVACAPNPVKIMREQADECGASGVKSTRVRQDGDDGDVDSEVNCR